MSAKPRSLSIGLFITLVFTVLFLVSGCGSSSSSTSSTTGAITFSGNVLALPQAASLISARQLEGALPLSGVTIGVGSGSGISDENGMFQFGVEPGSFDPGSFEIVLTNAGETTMLMIPALPDQANIFQFDIVQSPEGNFFLESAGVGEIELFTGAIEVPTEFQVQCFCDDDFGPVAEDFICADTGMQPTNCQSVEVPIGTELPSSEPCTSAADIICNCAEVDCPEGGGGECSGAAETASQCILDNEADVCTYFADLAEDPAQVVADDYENGYADNCL